MLSISHRSIEIRTTLNIDDDVLTLAKALAEARRISLGKAVSYLARRGVSLRAPLKVRNGFHVFSLDHPTPRFGPEDVRVALEAEDQAQGSSFWEPPG